MKKDYAIRSVEHIHREYSVRLDDDKDLGEQAYNVMANFLNLDGMEDFEIVEIVPEDEEGED